MDIYVTLPAKKVIDVRPFKADFAPYLAVGETLSSVIASVEVFTGVDANPEDILYLAPEITGTAVTQRLRAGIPGNIYTVTLTATTSLDHELTAQAVQAVLPDGVPAHDIFIPLYLTTPPYPLNVIEGVSSTSTLDAVEFYQITIDGITSTSTLISGTLRDILQSYTMLPEGIDSTSSLVSGILKDTLIFYTGKAEGITSTSSLQSGVLKDTLISYSNYKPEGILSGSSILSGTLV